MSINGIGKGRGATPPPTVRSPDVEERPAQSRTANTTAKKGTSSTSTFEQPKADYRKLGTREPAPGDTGKGVGAAAAAGAAAGAAAVQAAQDAKRLQDIKTLLADSPTGAAAVKYLEDKNIKVEFANGGGSYWDGNKIVIDRSRPMERNALSLVHEINHAKASIDGPKADIVKDTRTDYVKKMLDEEVRGTVDSIKAKNELVAKGKSISATYPLEDKYNAAYKKAVDDAKKANPKATEAELKKIGEKAGYERVLKGFQDGEVTTSTTGVKYPDYYGQAWDKAHPKK
ncbi:hypothetical protein JY651_06000 [Pyxidicoccus parkwayensis]|uniref:Uncharacterized protein n=1 Tax=Pyxidicoccus parkwayensis TaxID=2813578 RepID=A0ABX7P185_9BACT|nr:hypothetical protein [Pyxidicoccus parkwaysis]QSQ24504.1 hypothetical protein JY651_06000 [Pyxidicoccus parkwaysis]